MDMEFRWWEVALIFVTLLVRPPLYAFHVGYQIISKEYKEQALALKARIPLSKGSELKRQAREDANRTHGFMQLPGELRNRIYSLCMVSETVIDIDPIWGGLQGLKQIDGTEGSLENGPYYRDYIRQFRPEAQYEPRHMSWARMGNMGQVCKAWRIEAMRHFYGNNIFKLPIGKPLHKRIKLAYGGEYTEGHGYMIWPVWRLSYWFPSIVVPAGRFASRRYYPSWLQQRPKEAFAVMRLVLQDYYRCPHFVPQHNNQRLHGGYMILLDFEKRAFRAVRDTSHQDHFNLWDCDTCWKQFVANLIRLNRNEEIRELFAQLNDKMNANAAIRVVDGLRRILQSEYQYEYEYEYV